MMRAVSPWSGRALVLGLLVFVGACEQVEDVSVTADRSPDSPAAVAAGGVPPPLVDSAIAPAVAGEAGWMYSQSARADLDGDGEQERVVITARVELIRGRPAWDDGQPWQVYVEEIDGERTYLYSRYVQLGTLTMRVGLDEGPSRPSIVLIEHRPDQLAVYEAEYQGPGALTVTERFARTLDPTGDAASPMLP